MKKIITLVSCLISFSCLFSRGWKGDDTIAFRDSLMRKVEHLPADTSRLSVLLDAAYLHQNPPYNVFFACATAFPSVLSFKPYPSKIINTVGFLLMFLSSLLLKL